MIYHFSEEGIMTDLEKEIEDFRAAFCPYGHLDIQKAVLEALEAGKDGDWAFEQLEEFAESCGGKITELDPCYVVMDSILQIARNEIEGVTGFDLQNDASFYTQGNFMASTYDWATGDQETLVEALKTNPDALENLSDTTKYWLNQVEIDFDLLTGGE